MNRHLPPSLLFLQLPDLQTLLSLTVTLQEDGDLRSRQFHTCRELVLLYSDVLVSPALDSFTDISVLMTVQYFHKGIIQAYAHRRHLQLGAPRCVFPGDVQRCLSYTLIVRLAPGWNKAGHYLIFGEDFLTQRGRLNAVSVELSTSKSQLCLSVQGCSIRLPPITLQDFDLPPLVLRRFSSDPEATINTASTHGARWCHVLPSMRKGQIVTISRKLPSDGPFRTYRDLQSHWNRLYGYRLPELPEEEVVYCSVYFRPLGEKLFTYPLSCLRLQPVQRCDCLDLQGALLCFLSDVRSKLQSVCGVPARVTSRPHYSTVGLETAAAAAAAATQVLNGEQVSLSTSLPFRSVLSQPAPAPPAPAPPPRPGRPSFGSQPAAKGSCQQGGAQQPVDGKGGFAMSQRQMSLKDGGSSSNSSSSVSYSFSVNDPDCPTSSLLLLPPASHLTSTSSLLVHRRAQSVTSSPSSVTPPPAPPLPPSSHTSVNFPSRLVPIFRNKHPSGHINVAQLWAENQKKLMGVGGGQRGRVALPTLGRKTPTAASAHLSVLPALSSLVRPPAVISSFNHRLKRSHVSTAPEPSDHPQIKRISSLGPASKSKPGVLLGIIPKLKSSLKTPTEASTGSSTKTKSSRNLQEHREPAGGAPEPQTSSGSSTCSKKRVTFKQKPNQPKGPAQDVEEMVKTNQVLGISSASITAWLRLRGVQLTGKHSKDQLLQKVINCLAEA